MRDGSPPSRCWSPSVEPVPALLHIRRLGLTWIGNQERLFLGHFVHPCAGGEVVGILGAAVQHDHDREGLARVAAGRVHLVCPATDVVRKGPLLEPSAVGREDRRLSHRS